MLLKKKKRPCSHSGKSFCCNKVTLADIMKNRNKLYSAQGKIQQDIVLMHFISANDPQRKRPRLDTKPKTVSVKYFLKTVAHGMVPVCKAFFCFAMGLSKSRVLHVAKQINLGSIPNEKRGGDRVSRKFSAKKEAVRKFLSNLRGYESH